MDHKFSVLVNVAAPRNTYSKRELSRYIREAVACWGGQYHPDHPFFGLREKNVKVRSIVEQKRK